MLQQNKNDVECRHLNLGSVSVFHVTRLKPFFDSPEDALSMSRIDNDQFVIVKVLGYVGNTFKRSSINVKVQFDDGDEPLLPLTLDLTSAGPFKDFVEGTPSLWPLRFKTGAEAFKQRTLFNKQVIRELLVHDSIFVDLRLFNGVESSWYDQFNLPVGVLHCFSSTVVDKIKQGKMVRIHIPILTSNYDLDALDVHMYVHHTATPTFVVVDASWKISHPTMFQL